MPSTSVAVTAAPDVLSRCRVLCYRTRRCAAREVGCFVDICDADCDTDRIREVTPISGSDRHGIGRFRFIIQCSVGSELTRCADDTERTRIRATECIGWCIAGIHICRSNSSPDICTRCRVLCYRTRRSAACETWCLVDVRYIDRDRNAIAAGRCYQKQKLTQNKTTCFHSLGQRWFGVDRMSKQY